MTTASEDLLKRITARPDVFNGKPIIRDMRISVELVLSLLSQGASHEELMDDYPDLEEEDILACIAYAHAVKATATMMTNNDRDANDAVTAVYTDDPALVSGCRECLELMTEDPGDDNEYMGHCLHCRCEITAQGRVEWRRTVRRPCPYCGKAGW